MSNFSIVSFYLFETDSQVNQFKNNFVITGDVDNLANTLYDQTANGINLSKRTIAKTVGQCVGYGSGRVNEMALIEGGWNSPRLRFELLVAISNSFGSHVTYVTITGYTDYIGINALSSNSIKIDPNMIFYINNIVKSVESKNANGITFKAHENEQVLTGQETFTTIKTMRPEDLFGQLSCEEMIRSSSNLSVNLEQFSGFQGNGRTVDNFKTNEGTFFEGASNLDVMKYGEPGLVANSRENNNVTNYLTRQITEVVSRIDDLRTFDSNNINLSTGSVFSDVADTLSSNGIKTNSFMHILGQNSDVNKSGSFTYQELLDVDKNKTINNPNVIQFFQKAYNNLSMTSFCNGNWNDARYETTIASIVRDSLPCIMISSSLGHVRFSYTNAFGTDSIAPVPIMYGKPRELDTVGFGDRNMSHDISMMPSNPYTDIRRSWENLKRNFLDTIVPIITRNGEVIVEIDVEMNIRGEFIIGVSVENNADKAIYSTPMFADKSVSPIVTSNHIDVTLMANVIRNVSNRLADSRTNVLESSVGTPSRSNFGPLI